MERFSKFDRKAIQDGVSGSLATAAPITPASISPSKAPVRKHETQFDELRRSLLAIMPSQHDIKIILQAAESWWTMRFDGHSSSNSDDARSRWLSSCFSSLTTSHPSFIARALLLVASSLQQLPSDYDFSQLSLPLLPADLMEKCLSDTCTFVTSNDELVGTMEGLECLLLQGICFSNEGKPRRAWLCLRRALDVAQLMGLHRHLRLSDRDKEFERMGRLIRVWWEIFEADRYIALVLGLSYGIANKHCDLEADSIEALGVGREEIYRRKLAIIAGDIIDRNQASKTLAFAATQEIDEKLERLASEMPASWWELPTSPWPGGLQSVARLNSRALTQFCHYQFEALLHLPFMLRSTAEPRFKYNRSVCLKASREMIYRYIILRDPYTRCRFICKITDFQAFTAVIVLILNLLEPRSAEEDHTQRQRDEHDWQEIEKVMRIFGDKTACIDEAVATHGIKVIKTLSDIGRNGGQNSGSMKLAIPYFGTISIAKESRSQSGAAAQRASESTSRLQFHHSAAPVTHGVPFPPPPGLQQYQELNTFAPDSYHIDFTPSSVVPPFNPADTLAGFDGLYFNPADPTMLQDFVELDQGVGENWNFSLEGRFE